MWWDLPGPSAWLSLLEQDLIQGRNLVLALPRHHPGGLREALARRMRQHDLLTFRGLDLGEEPLAQVPARLMCERFLPGHRPPSAQTLAQADAGLVVWIGNMRPELWPAWRAFVLEYEHACRGLPEFDRSRLVIPLIGDLAREPPAEAVALALRRWARAVDRIDMLLYHSLLMRERALPPLYRNLAIAVGAELSGSDPELAEMLVQAELAALLRPDEMLLDLAARRGWARAESPRWENGTLCDTVDEGTRVHSAAVLLAGNREEIGRRLWRGEVGVLFPFIEEQRVRLIDEMGGGLRGLEVGHLLAYARRAGMPAATLRLLARLVAMRHALAHLEPVLPEDLLSSEVAAAARRRGW